MGAAAIPMNMALLWPGSRLGGEFADSYISSEMVSSFASLILLVVIALERVYSVFRPYRHRVLSRTPYWVGLFMSWFLAVIPVVFWVSPFISFRDRLLLILAFMAAVSIVIVVSYVTICLKLKTTRVEGLRRIRRVLRERKLAKTLAILAGVRLFTWLPFSIFSAFTYINLLFYTIMQRPFPEAFHHILCACKALHYSNSFMNPLIYSFRISQVRGALGKIFRGHIDEVAAPVGLRSSSRRRKIRGGNGGEDERRGAVAGLDSGVAGGEGGVGGGEGRGGGGECRREGGGDGMAGEGMVGERGGGEGGGGGRRGRGVE